MGPIEELADAVLAHDALRARSIVQDIHRAAVDLSEYPAPTGVTLRVRTMAAALVDLLTERQGRRAPAWARGPERFPEPVYVAPLSLRSEKHRALCMAESPAPLARRNVFAPSGFLTSA